MQNRIEVFEQMLAADPTNTMVMFGLAKEYEKLGRYEKVIRTLEDYLAKLTTKATPTARSPRIRKNRPTAKKPSRPTRKA